MTSEPAPKRLDLPPFPPLAWDEYAWGCDVVLPSWAEDGSGGVVPLSVQSYDEETRAAPTAEQTAAFRWLTENERETYAAVLDAVSRAYPRMREMYGYQGEEAHLMPPIDRPGQLREMIGLSSVHVLTTARDGVAYVGYGLGCDWDEEHGLGVMTHRGRVIEVGLGYTAFSHESAEKDRGAAG